MYQKEKKMLDILPTKKVSWSLNVAVHTKILQVHHSFYLFFDPEENEWLVTCLSVHNFLRCHSQPIQDQDKPVITVYFPLCFASLWLQKALRKAHPMTTTALWRFIINDMVPSLILEAVYATSSTFKSSKKREKKRIINECLFTGPLTIT